MYFGFTKDYMRIPRKLKKQIFGKRMQKGKLRKLLESVTIGESRAKTMYEMSDIKPYAFCHKCGHTGFHGTCIKPVHLCTEGKNIETNHSLY